MKFWGSVLSLQRSTPRSFHALHTLLHPVGRSCRPFRGYQHDPAACRLSCCCSRPILGLGNVWHDIPDHLSVQGLSPLCNNTSSTRSGLDLSSCPSKDWMSLMVYLASLQNDVFGDNLGAVERRDQNITRVLRISAQYIVSGASYQYGVIATVQSWIIAEILELAAKF